VKREAMSAQKCAKCEKSVYPLEMIVACNKSWHKGCFTCTHCHSVISLKSFASLEEKPYCKPHFLELFKSKGNYKAISGDSNESSSYNASAGFKGVGLLSSVKNSPPALKHSETVYKSAPQIEKDVKIKKVDRTGFLEEVGKGSDLHHPEKIHDSSAPKIPVKVTLGDHEGLLKEVEGEHSLKHPTEVHDSSAPHLENVQVRKVDRKEILREGVVEHPPKLRDVDDLVNDRSSPVIEETAQVKTGSRVALFQSIAQANETVELKKPDATTDRSSPKVGPSAGGASKCYKCGKSVYDLEMLKACDKIWHKSCFRCKHCDGVLSLKGFATIDSDPYCKPHYLEIFKSKGTYKAFSESGENSTSYNATGAFKGY